MSKKLVSFLSMILCVSLLLPGCTSNAKKTDQESKTNTAVSDSKVSPPGIFPITKEKITFKVVTVQDQTIDDIDSNEFTKWYEDKTNIHIQWTVLPGSAVKEKIQVLLAGGELPDIFMNGGINANQTVAYAAQGAFRPLDDLIEKYAPNIKKMLNEKPFLYDYMRTPDGKIYSLTGLTEVLHTYMPKKLWIYKPWLDKLGLAMPATTEDFYQVLKTFKAKDPNGNGKADEIPLAGANSANNEVESFFMQSFLFYERGTYLTVENGKILFTADKPEFKEGIKYLKKLFDEGLLAPESFTQDRKPLTALVEDPAGTRIGAIPSLYWGHFSVDNGPSGRYKEYAAVPVLKGPQGKAITYTRHPGGFGSNLITTKCQNPEAAMRWFDWFYDTEGSMKEGYTAGMGKEGRDWKRLTPDSGLKGIDGNPATFQRIVNFGAKQAIHWNQMPPGYWPEKLRVGEAQPDQDSLEVKLQEITKKYYQPYQALEKRVPFMFYPDEVLAKYGDQQAALDKIVQTWLVRFITTGGDMEKDWGTYTKELENAGVKDYIKTVQDNYDKYLKNKK